MTAAVMREYVPELCSKIIPTEISTKFLNDTF